MLKKTVLLLFAATGLLLLTACGEASNEALVIILGRHANAREFSSGQYAEVERRLEKTAYGGYVRIIIGGGNPTLVPVSTDTYLEKYDEKEIKNGKVPVKEKTGKGDKMKTVALRTIPTPEGYYFPDSGLDKEKIFIRQHNLNEIMNFIKDRQNVATHATHPENDLFEAIRLAQITLSNIEKDARRKHPGKSDWKLKRQRIIIMDTGIVTTGEMDFTRFGLESVDFKKPEEVKEVAKEKIINHLEINSAELNLKDIGRIDFIGLGDVAHPQTELTSLQIKGLKTIWDDVLTKFGAKENNGKVVFYENSEPRQSPEPDLPPVSIIEFGGAPEPPVLDVLFECAKDTYVDREKTKTALGGYANSFKRRLSADPSLKLYIVGAESRDGYRSRDLSNRRAYAVKNSLASLGVTSDRIIAFGVGIDDPWRSDEGPDANGKFNEKIAEKNRKVVFFYSSDAEKVKKAEEARDKK